MQRNANQIIAEIENHFVYLSEGTKYSDLYIGITNDIQRRLFNEHNVSREKDWFIASSAVNSEHSRFVEKYYLDKGMQGGGGGGDNTAIYIYCYKIGPYTKE